MEKFTDFSAYVLAFTIRILNVTLSFLVNNILRTVKNFIFSTRLSLKIRMKSLMLFISKSIKRLEILTKWNTKRGKIILSTFCQLWLRSVIIILYIKPTFCLTFGCQKGVGWEEQLPQFVREKESLLCLSWAYF